MNKKTLTLLIASLTGTQVWAGTITVPNTFVDGATSSAGEVNENFNAVKSAVDDNYSRTTTNANDINLNSANIAANTNAISTIGGISVLVNGVRVGSLLRYPIFSSSPIAILLPSNYLAVISPIGEGLYPDSAVGSATGNQILYLSNNCTGQAYAKGDTVETFVSFGQGQLYAKQGVSPLTIYYIPSGTPAETLTYNSKDIGVGCTAESAATVMYKAFLNDSNVTGITNAELMGSVTISN